jgi:hypothetical protein
MQGKAKQSRAKDKPGAEIYYIFAMLGKEMTVPY